MPPAVRFNNLQILRLFAACGVALFHLGNYSRHSFGVSDGPVLWLDMPWIASAFVPMFFALSGFVLTHALRSTTPGQYLLLRFLRLYPGYWLAVALVTISFYVGLWPGAHLKVGDPAPNYRTIGLFATKRVSGGQYPLTIEWTLIYEVFLSVSLVVLWKVAGAKRLTIAIGVWLAVLAVKSIVWPGFGSRMLPVLKSIWASVHLVPFLFGVLAYQCRDRGRRWRWPVFALIVGLMVLGAGWFTMKLHLDLHYWTRGLASALTVWFLVQVRDTRRENPLAIAGGYSYGLYLIHVPLILLAMRAMQVTGFWFGTWPGVWLAGLVALSMGLAFGRLESSLYVRAKRLLDPTVRESVRRRFGEMWHAKTTRSDGG